MYKSLVHARTSRTRTAHPNDLASLIVPSCLLSRAIDHRLHRPECVLVTHDTHLTGIYTDRRSMPRYLSGILHNLYDVDLNFFNPYHELRADSRVWHCPVPACTHTTDLDDLPPPAVDSI